jgi:hypothetical protein
VLRWLTGDDDHPPVTGPGRGELVGGFGDVVRSPDQIAGLITKLTDFRRPADDIRSAGEVRRADYRAGVIATANWILHRHTAAPLTGSRSTELTTHDLKIERLHARDQAEQAEHLAHGGLQRSKDYASGVISTINWLLGDSTPLAS